MTEDICRTLDKIFSFPSVDQGLVADEVLKDAEHTEQTINQLMSKTL